jgi:hypothetical protein
MNLRGNIMRHSIPSFLLMAILAAAGLHGAGCTTSAPLPTPTPGVSGRSGVTHNAITVNALTTNALTTNAANLQALVQSKLVDASFETGSLSEALWDPSAQQVMAYLVSCALAPDQSVTWRPMSSIDPPPAETTWQGALALCPQWHEGGIAGDASCQELVSACLLARNNAAGVEVQISLRGRDTRESYFGSGDVVVGDVTHPEHELYRWREGAFYGNILDPGGLDRTLEVRVERAAQQVEVSYWRPNEGVRLGTVLQMPAGVYARSSAAERVAVRDQGHDAFMSGWEGGKTMAHRNAFACWSPEWSEAVAYFHARTCAGPAGKERCLAEPVGACRTSAAVPGAPELQCSSVYTPPDGHGDFDDCAGAATAWRYPITVFLPESCAVVPGTCQRLDQPAGPVQVAAARTRGGE